MSELEEKLSSVLSNPQLMQQIMAMAQSMGAAQEETPEPKQPQMPSLPDPELLRQLSGITQGAGVDSNQKALLAALGPYLSRERVSKLERAMRAAKMAKLASSFMGSGGLQHLMGR